MQCTELYFSPVCSAVAQWSSEVCSWTQCIAANHVVHFDILQFIESTVQTSVVKYKVCSAVLHSGAVVIELGSCVEGLPAVGGNRAGAQERRIDIKAVQASVASVKQCCKFKAVLRCSDVNAMHIVCIQ